MLISAFTPTHRPKNLLEAYRSLQEQGNVPWEWVIVPNGSCTTDTIPSAIRDDDRVRIVPFTGKEKQPNIGQLKRFACDHCQGDALLELDHDDLLVPRALDRVIAKLEEGNGFVFSDAACFLSENANLPQGYDPRYGWETYNLMVYGKRFMAHRAFPVTARSLCEIFYAPDHLRCWSRKAYFRIGGHNPSLKVGDDHELIIRTYLARIPFAHTEDCGYLYRTHPGNTHRAWNKEVLKQQFDNRQRFTHQLIDEWCRRHSYHFVDLRNPNQFDWKTLQIDMDDSSVGCVKIFDITQHLAREQIVPFMHEVYRVLCEGGWACFATPSADGPGAFAPHFKSFWNAYTFHYFCEQEHAAQLDGYNARFQMVRAWPEFPSQSYKRAKIPYIYADLVALKGQRQPGLVEI